MRPNLHLIARPSGPTAIPRFSRDYVTVEEEAGREEIADTEIMA
jgi:hypothetical protein